MSWCAYVNLREGQPEPDLTGYSKVRRLPVTAWPLIVFCEGEQDARSLVERLIREGYDAKTGETLDLQPSGGEGLY